MPPVYRYRRGVGRAVVKEETPDASARKGELIAITGKKHRTYRAPVTLDANNKPIRTPLVDVGRRKKERPTQLPLDQERLDWVTVFGEVVKGETNHRRPLR